MEDSACKRGGHSWDEHGKCQFCMAIKPDPLLEDLIKKRDQLSEAIKRIRVSTKQKQIHIIASHVADAIRKGEISDYGDVLRIIEKAWQASEGL